MFFKPSQKSELADVIRRFGFEPTDFILKEGSDEKNPSLSLKHKSTDARFIVVAAESAFAVNYAPSAYSTRPETHRGINWNSVIQYLQSWVQYVKADAEADNPWDEQTQEDFEEFHNDDGSFTPEELVRLDRGIEASFERLLLVAKEQGYEASKKDIAQIAEDVRYLKEQARITSKRKWLDLFMGVIVSKLVEWGLGTTFAAAIFAKLVEMSHEVLKLTTHLPPPNHL